METMCKHYDKLTNKVANLEAISATPTKASKKKSSNMSKRDASTSCNDLCLDSSLCNQVCVEKVVDTYCRGPNTGVPQKVEPIATER